MRLMARIASIAVVAFATASCDGVIGSDDDDDTFYLRVVNLVTDSPSVGFYVDDVATSSATYFAGSGYTSAHPGSRTLTLKAAVPADLDDDDDDTDPLLFGASLAQSYAADTAYTVIAYGKMDNPQYYTISGTGLRDDVDETRFAYQFIDASPTAGSIDVYITAPEAGISSPQLVSTLNSGGHTEPVELTLQEQEDSLTDDATLYARVTIEIRRSGTNELLYTSGKLVVYEEGRMSFIIADNIGSGPSPVKVLALDNSGTSTELGDPSDNAALRLVHQSSDSPTLNLLGGTSLQTPIAQNVTFNAASAYTTVKSGSVGMLGVPTDNPGSFLFVDVFTAAPNLRYSAYAVGPLAELDAVILSDASRSIPTQAQFRFFNIAPSLESSDSLDVYLVASGAGLDLDPEDEDDLPSTTFTALSYKTVTGYATLAGGTYDAYFAYAGTSTLALGPVSVAVTNGSVTTFALADSATTGQLEIRPVTEW